MFARAVSIKVRPDCESELSRIFEQKVVPRFRQERDFLGLLAFIRTDGTQALSFSFWDQEKRAEANCPADLSALTALVGVIHGTPAVQAYWVSHSILQTMKNILSQEEGVEASPDLEFYQSCGSAFPIVARTVHAELRFPASVAPYESKAQRNPALLC